MAVATWYEVKNTYVVPICWTDIGGLAHHHTTARVPRDSICIGVDGRTQGECCDERGEVHYRQILSIDAQMGR